MDHHPFDEALHSRIIAALAATGRQGEALRQCEIIRRTLAEDPGAEPGPDLRAARERLSGSCRPTGRPARLWSRHPAGRRRSRISGATASQGRPNYQETALRSPDEAKLSNGAWNFCPRPRRAARTARPRSSAACPEWVRQRWRGTGPTGSPTASPAARSAPDCPPG
nr:BTAD domain-containing putative transcriptional regulator [Streptomyces sp. 3214.6]